MHITQVWGSYDMGLDISDIQWGVIDGAPWVCSFRVCVRMISGRGRGMDADAGVVYGGLRGDARGCSGPG